MASTARLSTATGRLSPAVGCFPAQLPLRALAPLLSIWAGCSGGTSDPRSLPYRLEEFRDFNAPVAAVDFNGDGHDEVVSQYVPGRVGPPGIRAVLIQRHDGRVIEQLNFDGFVLPPRFLDINGDSRPEMLVPVVRNDSLFATFADGSGAKLHTIFLIDGKPRIEPDGALPWDPMIVDAYVIDVDGNGTPELVTMVNTAYARLPRGVLIHSLPEGRPIGRVVVGSNITQSALGDFDADGRLEVLTLGAAVNNGARAGGFDDSRAFLVAFELSPTPRVDWWREVGATWVQPHLDLVDTNRDGRQELIVVGAGEPAETARLQVIEPGTWRVLRERLVNAPLSRSTMIDLDGDGRVEIAAIREPDEIWVFDADLELVRRRRVRSHVIALQRWPDLDGDQIEELVASRYAGSGGPVLLTPGLRVKVALGEGSVSATVRRGLGASPLLLIDRGGRATAVQLVQNPWDLYFRYGGPGLRAGGAAAVLALLVALEITRRRNRLLRAVQSTQFQGVDGGSFLLDRRGRIHLLHPGNLPWLTGEADSSSRIRTLDQLASRSPSLARFCQELTRAQPAQRIEGNAIPSSPDRRSVQVVAAPVFIGNRADPHWLVRLDPVPRMLDPEVANAWYLMARDLAHDIKNPLSAILVKLKSMQRECRDGPQELLQVLHRYGHDIEERIEQLRRTTSSFMKFVDIDKPRRAAMDINAFVTRAAAAIARGLPPDIHLDLQLDAGPADVAMDSDQMYSVLDNLIANAFHAMPDGGIITLSTRRTRRDTADAAHASIADGIEIRVADTGRGIPTSDLPHIFEPHFSTRQDGAGLGLAIVRKIVRDHGGEIAAESLAGRGTELSIFLPLLDGADPNLSPPATGNAPGVA